MLLIKRTVSIRQNKSLGAYLTGLVRPRIVIGIILVNVGYYLPHLKKQERQAPCRLAFHHNGGILPMTVLFILIDIFVSKIDPTRKGYLAVNRHDLSVVTVVLFRRKERTEGIEHGTFYAEFLHT